MELLPVSLSLLWVPDIVIREECVVLIISKNTKSFCFGKKQSVFIECSHGTEVWVSKNLQSLNSNLHNGWEKVNGSAACEDLLNVDAGAFLYHLQHKTEPVT